MVEPRKNRALLTRVPTIDDVLEFHASAIGRDLVAYRNHIYRVVNLCVAIAGSQRDLEKIAVAAVFHDIGIWTDRTFDYLPPSIRLAREHLAACGLAEWSDEIASMIANHHKITPADAQGSLVEAFRRADWIDVTRGLRRFGVEGAFIASLYAAWPDTGFHWRLVQLGAQRLRTHPLSPLPMFKL